MPVAGPAAELGADDELRPDPREPLEVAAPAAAVVLRRRRVERRRVGREGLESLASSRFRVAAVKPDPTLPANRSLPSS